MFVVLTIRTALGLSSELSVDRTMREGEWQAVVVLGAGEKTAMLEVSENSVHDVFTSLSWISGHLGTMSRTFLGTCRYRTSTW